jgi:GTPase
MMTPKPRMASQFSHNILFRNMATVTQP